MKNSNMTRQGSGTPSPQYGLMLLDLVDSHGYFRLILSIAVVLGRSFPRFSVKLRSFGAVALVTVLHRRTMRTPHETEQEEKNVDQDIRCAIVVYKETRSLRKSHYRHQILDLSLRSLHIDDSLLASMFASLLYLVGLAAVSQCGPTIQA